MTAVEQGLERYLGVFASLDISRLQQLRACFSPDARFKDPFNSVQGADAIVQVFRHMFDTLEEPRFRVTASALDGAVALLHWEFDFRLRDHSAQQRIVGMSMVTFTRSGLVAQHVDHWDAAEQVYAKIPLLRLLLRWLRRRFSAS